jgi:hypothetical protein
MTTKRPIETTKRPNETTKRPIGESARLFLVGCRNARAPLLYWLIIAIFSVFANVGLSAIFHVMLGDQLSDQVLLGHGELLLGAFGLSMGAACTLLAKPGITPAGGRVVVGGLALLVGFTVIAIVAFEAGIKAANGTLAGSGLMTSASEGLYLAAFGTGAICVVLSSWNVRS